ncbi:MAG TPA: hypothetical protein VJB11_03090 [archaeon]|nr:hypothetical protein [archaeon]
MKKLVYAMIFLLPFFISQADADSVKFRGGGKERFVKIEPNEYVFKANDKMYKAHRNEIRKIYNDYLGKDNDYTILFKDGSHVAVYLENIKPDAVFIRKDGSYRRINISDTTEIVFSNYKIEDQLDRFEDVKIDSITGEFQCWDCYINYDNNKRCREGSDGKIAPKEYYSELKGKFSETRKRAEQWIDKINNFISQNSSDWSYEKERQLLEESENAITEIKNILK